VSNTPSNQAPPGWYPVAAGSTQLRWWDGTAWTEHVHETAVPQAATTAAPVVQQAPEGTQVSTIWGWLAGATPLLSLVVYIPLYFWLQTVFTPQVLSNPNSITAAASSPSYLVPSLLSWVIIGLFVLFCALDWRALTRNGVPAPFHWAWSFFAFLSPGGLVYLIGRGIVIKRRTGQGGLGPLWLFVALNVVLIIIVTVALVALFGNIAAGLSTNLNNGNGVA
jgi:hypothetical protein